VSFKGWLLVLAGILFGVSLPVQNYGTVIMDTGARYTGIIEWGEDFVKVHRASGPIILDLQCVESVE
jgi:hypothetical protein